MPRHDDSQMTKNRLLQTSCTAEHFREEQRHTNAQNRRLWLNPDFIQGRKNPDIYCVAAFYWLDCAGFCDSSVTICKIAMAGQILESGDIKGATSQGSILRAALSKRVELED